MKKFIVSGLASLVCIMFIYVCICGITGCNIPIPVPSSTTTTQTSPTTTTTQPTPVPTTTTTTIPAPIPGPKPIVILCGIICNMPSSDKTSEITRRIGDIPEIRFIETRADKFLLADDNVFHCIKNTDGTYTVWADDFISKTVSNVVYKYDQIRVEHDSNPGIFSNPTILKKGNLTGGTMRCRWIAHNLK